MAITSNWSRIPKLVPAFAFSDSRGQLMEVGEISLSTPANIKFSVSMMGALRGMHFQAEPYQQAKIIRVCSGSILDVAIDLHTGDLYEIALDSGSQAALYIPADFAHGFQSLADNSTVVYISTNQYHPGAERAYSPFVRHFKSFSWRGEQTRLLVSEKDRNAPPFPFGAGSRHFRFESAQWRDMAEALLIS